MRFAKVRTAAISRLNIIVFDLEISILQGLPSFEISGSNSLKGQQCFSRVRAALNNNGFRVPRGRIVCHLTKDIKDSEARSIDLALAIAILIADKQILTSDSISWFIVGQLGLSGKIQRINGIFAMSREDELNNYHWIIPEENQNELQEVDLTNKYIAKTICTACDILESKNIKNHVPLVNTEVTAMPELKPIYEILGQPLAKRALIIALTGWHPLLLIGSPGSGKTTLASQSARFMPKLKPAELEDVKKLHSMHGLWKPEIDQGHIRPFEAPHHTVTQMALIGGGANLEPGIITYAHNGILFLDELCEFKPYILELLRQPLSEKYIELARKNVRQKYPADFLLIGATNPCPCGYLLEKDGRCKCSTTEVNRYKKKLSGALMDRFQLSVVMNDLPNNDLIKTAQKKLISNSEINTIQDQISTAQNLQFERCLKAKKRPQHNGVLEVSMIANFFHIDHLSLNKFNSLINNHKFSPRSYLSLLRVARTIADLEESITVTTDHLHEALLLRVKTQIY